MSATFSPASFPLPCQPRINFDQPPGSRFWCMVRSHQLAAALPELLRECPVGQQFPDEGAHLFASPGCVNSALSRWVTISGIPPTFVATVGTPAAMASSKAFGEPSRQRRQHGHIGDPIIRFGRGDLAGQRDRIAERQFRLADCSMRRAPVLLPQSAGASSNRAMGRSPAASER